MTKKRKKTGSRSGLQVVTLCISTAMVLILLGMVVFSVLSARNLSNYVKENLTITVLLGEDMTTPEARQLCKELMKRPYIHHLNFISKEDALKEQSKEMGTDPSEFAGFNPFVGSIELQLNSDYANSDSIKWISKQLQKNPQVTDITYPQELMDSVNSNLKKINLVLLILAVLLTFVSFSLINNTVRLGVYAKRFSIHTMKLVGASWGFIRKPFIKRGILVGILAGIVADLVLAGGIYLLYTYEPQVLTVITWDVMLITGLSVLLFGIIITMLCSYFSVNKFLRMKAGDLYKI
jgi:cell division transport system permease protein